MTAHQANRKEGLTIAGAVVFIAAVALTTHPSPRQFSALLGAVCIAGILLRLIGYWTAMTTLERALGVLLGLTILIAAVGTYRLDKAGAPASGIVWYIIAHRILTLATVAAWPWWVGRTGTTKDRLSMGLRRSV